MLKTKNNFESYEDYESYIKDLVDDKVLCEGCTYCSDNGGCDNLDDALEKSKGDRVYCTPMGDIPEGLAYPVTCIKEQYGKDSLYCPECKEVHTSESWEYDKDDNEICPDCKAKLIEY